MWGPSAFRAPIIPAVLRGAGVGALMAAAGLLLFLAGAKPDAAQIGDARVRSVTTTFLFAAVVLLGAHLVSWLVYASPDLRFDTEWATSALGDDRRAYRAGAGEPNDSRAVGMVAGTPNPAGARVRDAGGRRQRSGRSLGRDRSILGGAVEGHPPARERCLGWRALLARDPPGRGRRHALARLMPNAFRHERSSRSSRSPSRVWCKRDCSWRRGQGS